MTKFDIEKLIEVVTKAGDEAFAREYVGLPESTQRALTLEVLLMRLRLSMGFAAINEANRQHDEQSSASFRKSQREGK